MTEVFLKAFGIISFAFRVFALFTAAFLIFSGWYPIFVGMLAFPIARNLGEDWNLWWYKQDTNYDD